MTFRPADFHRLNRAILAVHAAPTMAQFATHLLQALREVVRGDIAVVDWKGGALEGGRPLTDQPQGLSADVNAALRRHLPDNPMYLRRHRATSISDVLPRRAWQRSALYGEAYGRLGQQDGLGIDIALGADQVLTLNTTRARRGFNERERLGLDLLRPHVLQHAHRLDARSRMREVLQTPQAMSRLTAREREVLHWVADGRSNAAIALLLGIRPGTVKRHLENLYAKLGVDGRGEARRLYLMQP